MSVFIKTMANLPEHCFDCPCHNQESGYCQAHKEYQYCIDRPSWCPLVKISNEEVNDMNNMLDKFVILTDRKRRKAICEAAGVKDIEDVSDGFHTFKQLYYQRMMLFAIIVKQNKDKAWKSLRHEDGELCFGGGWFVVGIDTPEGSYTYHYEDKYFDLFDCEELEREKHWDGHTEKDVTRLFTLQPSVHPVGKVSSSERPNKWIPVTKSLPEAEYGESDSVLVCFENKTQDVLYFDGSNWRYPTGETYVSVNHKNGWHNKVVAWMPLPEPYEPKESEENK